MITVLAVGGLVALVVALAAGAVIARRALVPIRDALRRQREFAADASHELRTPLAVVRASAEHLRRNPDKPVREVGTAVDDITAETDHLTALVEDLLLLARSDSGAVELAHEPVDLADVAADATGGLTGLAAESQVRIALDPEPRPGGRRRGPAPPARDDPRRQCDPPRSGRRHGDGHGPRARDGRRC